MRGAQPWMIAKVANKNIVQVFLCIVKRPRRPTLRKVKVRGLIPLILAISLPFPGFKPLL
jgi:hypothetical protein